MGATVTRQRRVIIPGLAVMTLALVAAPGEATASSPPRPDPAVSAALTTVQFKAKVILVDDEGVINGRVRVGEPVQGSYSYDPSLPDLEPSPNVGLYQADSNAGITITTKQFVFQSDPQNPDFRVIVGNDNPGDSFAVQSFHVLSPADGVRVESISWVMSDPTGTALSSDALLTAAPTVADFTQQQGLDIHGDSGSSGEQFTIRLLVTKAK
jgi:hypothetical protein